LFIIYNSSIYMFVLIDATITFPFIYFNAEIA